MFGKGENVSFNPRKRGLMSFPPEFPVTVAIAWHIVKRRRLNRPEVPMTHYTRSYANHLNKVYAVKDAKNSKAQHRRDDAKILGGTQIDTALNKTRDFVADSASAVRENTLINEGTFDLDLDKTIDPDNFIAGGTANIVNSQPLSQQAFVLSQAESEASRPAFSQEDLFDSSFDVPASTNSRKTLGDHTNGKKPPGRSKGGSKKNSTQVEGVGKENIPPVADGSADTVVAGNGKKKTRSGKEYQQYLELTTLEQELKSLQVASKKDQVSLIQDALSRLEAFLLTPTYRTMRKHNTVLRCFSLLVPVVESLNKERRALDVEGMVDFVAGPDFMVLVPQLFEEVLQRWWRKKGQESPAWLHTRDVLVHILRVSTDFHCLLSIHYSISTAVKDFTSWTLREEEGLCGKGEGTAEQQKKVAFVHSVAAQFGTVLSQRLSQIATDNAFH